MPLSALKAALLPANQPPQEDDARAALEVARLRLSALPGPAALEQQLRDAEAAAAAERQRAAEADARRAQARAEAARAEARAQELRAHARAKAAEADRLEGELAASARAAEADRAALQGVRRRWEELRSRWGEHPGWLEERELAAAADEEDGAEAEAESGEDGEGDGGEGEAGVGALTKQLQQLRVQLDRLGPEAAAGAAESATARARGEQAAAITALADQLAAEIGALESDVARGAAGVAAANDGVADDVAAGFGAMAGSLLPALELELVRAGQQAHEGLQIRCAGASLRRCGSLARMAEALSNVEFQMSLKACSCVHSVCHG